MENSVHRQVWETWVAGTSTYDGDSGRRQGQHTRGAVCCYVRASWESAGRLGRHVGV